MKHAILLTATVLLLGCGPKKAEQFQANDSGKRADTVSVSIVHYSAGKKVGVNRPDEHYLIIQKYSDSTEYSYKVKNHEVSKATGIKATRFHSTDSMRHWRIKIPLVDKRLFIINNEEIDVLKYYYDDKDAYDDESYLYFNDDMGIILIDSKAWYDTQVVFEDKSDKRRLLIEQIKADTTGFYFRRE